MNTQAIDFSRFDFAPVVRRRGPWHLFDFTGGYDSDAVRKHTWGIGRYDEKRPGMYSAPQYEDRRNIHIGIDFWTPPGEPVYAFYDGEIAYFGNNDRPGDYGPTIVIRHRLGKSLLFALYGHLTRDSLEGLAKGQPVGRGEAIGRIGRKKENGGWEPHLHFQLSIEDPGEADMPGVVSEENRLSALDKYPDPRLIVGALY